MTISERAAYLKGLAEGMKIDDSTDTGKITLQIIDVLKYIGLAIEEHDEVLDDMGEIVYDIEESVYELEDEVFGESDHNHEFDEDDEYDITCPKCENILTVDFDVIDTGEVRCPNCGELIKFEVDFLDQEDCDCCPGHDN